MNSHFLLLPALTAICSHQLQQFCLGHGAEEGLEGTSKVGPVFGGPTPQSQHLFHLWIGVWSPPALRGALQLGDEKAQESYWLLPSALLPCQGQNFSVPAYHRGEEAVIQVVCTPSKQTAACLDHQPEFRITAWGLHPTPEPAGLSRQVQVLPALEYL